MGQRGCDFSIEEPRGAGLASAPQATADRSASRPFDGDQFVAKHAVLGSGNREIFFDHGSID
jgi:hypothetical protein